MQINHQIKVSEQRKGCRRPGLMILIVAILVFIPALLLFMGWTVKNINNGTWKFDFLGPKSAETDQLVAENSSETIAEDEQSETEVSGEDTSDDTQSITEADQNENAPNAKPPDSSETTADDESPPVEDPDEAPSPEPESDPEPTEEAAHILNIVMAPILGISLKAYPDYNVGDMARIDSTPDPYVFVKLGYCDMRVHVYNILPAKLNNLSLTEELIRLYQREYVDALQSSASYELLVDPYDVEVDAGPAARMEAIRVLKEPYLMQLTLINQNERYALVRSTILQSCADRPNLLESLSEVADSVTLFPQENLCYVGHQPDSDPAKYRIGCSDPDYGFDGEKTLTNNGYSDIQEGPVTWDEAAVIMSSYGQVGWTAP